ncbi:hypothetical protein ILYODFUR_038035 [Ilyodon furcidens]|uniref:Uncharacterized protein n=1 Tax=Ilyodon furcidens TaxID=33524 RepID=A0ABV0UQH6_9TELE
MAALYRSVVVKRELSQKAKLSIYVPTLIYGHELWVMTGEMFQAHPTGRRPRGDPGHAGGTMFLGWHGNALGFLRTSWPKRLGKGKSEA